MARARRIVVTESTFSFWAAFLGRADEIHAPGASILPIPLAEPGYVFHDVKSERYWGRWNGTKRNVDYAYTGEGEVSGARRRRRRR